MTSKAQTAMGGPRARVRMVMMGMAFTVLAAVGVSAWAQPAPPPPPARMEGGPGMHHGEMHGGMHGGDMGHGMMFGSPRMIDRMLDGLNASDAQRTQIKQIVGQAATDLKAQREAGRGLRERGMQLFTAPNVDPAAVEQLRQQMLQQHDQASKRVSQAMLAVANVLTPEQRARLGERLRDHRARMEDRMKRMEHDRPPR